MKIGNGHYAVGDGDKAKIVALALCATLFLLWSSAVAQQTERVYRIGYLRFRPTPPNDPTHVAFRQGLQQLGYVEGQNLVIEYRSAEGKPERRPEVATELARLQPDLIVTAPAPPLIRAAQQATRTIPIVMAGVFVDPVKAGFVASLARPGGNITGLTNLESELHGKRLDLLKETFPAISRVAILWPNSPWQKSVRARI